MRRGLTYLPAILLLYVPQFFRRFSAWNLLAFCTCSRVLTSMYIKCGILESEVATSFLVPTCSLHILFFAFSLFVFSPCFFTSSCRTSSSFFKSLSLSVRGCVTSGKFCTLSLSFQFYKVSLIMLDLLLLYWGISFHRTATLEGVTWY